MEPDSTGKPQPQPTPVSQGYWEGARAGRLMLQRCGGCGAIRHYPRPVCSRCHSLKVDWVPASGEGVVHSWTVAHYGYHPAFKGEVPYVLLTVDLAEGVRALGRVDGIAVDDLRLGLPVRVRMGATENGYALPVFVPAAAAAAAASA